MQMTFSTDHEKNQALLESTRQRVKELEDRMGYKSQGLGEEEKDRLDTWIHNVKVMRRFIEPTDL